MAKHQPVDEREHARQILHDWGWTHGGHTVSAPPTETRPNGTVAGLNEQRKFYLVDLLPAATLLDRLKAAQKAEISDDDLEEAHRLLQE